MPQPVPWEKVSEALDAVLALPSDQRAGYLQAACPDETLRRYLESLVLSYQDSNFLEARPVLEGILPEGSEAPPRPWLGRRIGPYMLIEEIGGGGMGVVFRAIRADDHYLKTVAIKLMKGDFSSRFNLMRFRVERQILASLDHPNIARLLDGGTTEEGAPYLVLELVEGQPIDAYCDARRLSITERLKLFRNACAAVQFAHEHMVIHRDLKPRNVLVTEQGVVKLLDFGIAKILDPESFPQVVEPTLPVMRLLSPEYASPEQIRGEPITPLSDVYSLGVLLYHLLTGHPPYSVKTGNLSELSTVICEANPVKPSVVVGRAAEARTHGTAERITPESVSAVREGSVSKLKRRLEGDLDTIVLKALRKEPARRYGSVAQLSHDIQRHLEGMPVLAQPDRVFYRVGKFVSRYPRVVAAGVLVIANVVAGGALALHEARVAKEERARAQRNVAQLRKSAERGISEFVDAVEQLRGSEEARHVAVEHALRYLRSQQPVASGDAELKSEMIAAYEKLGDLEGGCAGAPGGSPLALASYQQALTLQGMPLESAGVKEESAGSDSALREKYQRCMGAAASGVGR